MDPRLLMAISDVLSGGSVASTLAAGPSGAQVAAEFRQDMLNSAAKGNASTGAPIPLLRGIAADRATVAAIGGGSKVTGGTGIVGGEKILSDSELKAQLATYGVKAAVIVAQVMLRYGVLVRQDRKAARAAELEAGQE